MLGSAQTDHENFMHTIEEAYERIRKHKYIGDTKMNEVLLR
jgi:hypothetical protein